MQKISDSTATANGNNEFTEGDPAAGIGATLLKANWLNTIQRELLAVLSAAGIAPAVGEDDQLAKAIAGLIRANSGGYVADTGAANTYVAAYVPAFNATPDGMLLRFKAKTANTGASTFSANGLTAKSVVGLGLVALQGGEIVAGGVCTVVWAASIDKWVLLHCSGAALQVGPGIRSSQALQAGQKGVVTLTASGSFTVPPGVYTIYVSGCAGGGGGGGSAGSSGTANNAGGGTGGGAGQPLLRAGYAVTPGQVILITIGGAGIGGNGGASGANNGVSGTAGGDTVIGSLATLSGGGGGGGGLIPGGGSQSTGYPAGGLGFDGNFGGAGGNGGSGPFGGGGGMVRGISTAGGTVGQLAAGFGAGGGGAGACFGAVAGAGAKGGNGTQGYVEIEY